MTTNRTKIKLFFGIALLASLCGLSTAQAAVPPVKLVLKGHFGREVNLTQTTAKSGPALEDLCTAPSSDMCQPGKTSSIAGGFIFPESVAGAPDGNFYVADSGNGRIDEFTHDGTFVLMFGREVDKTTVPHQDVCTAASGHLCGAGVKGSAAGQLDAPESVTVDPVDGSVYVAEDVYEHGSDTGPAGQRVQKFTAEGTFLWETGKEVNESTKTNLCTALDIEKGEKCAGPALRHPTGVSEGGHGALELVRFQGNTIAAGGEHDLLYVAGENSMQEFEADGTWTEEIALSQKNMIGIAIDSISDDIYTIYSEDPVVHRLDPQAKEISSFPVTPREAGHAITLAGVAIDGSGHLAVATREEPTTAPLDAQFGQLYQASTGKFVTNFEFAGQQVKGVTFNRQEVGVERKDELYAASPSGHSVLGYLPEPVAELITESTECVPSADNGTSATLGCILKGSINPNSVENTEAWFEWGATCALGFDTEKQQVPTVTELLPVVAPIASLRPDQRLCDRLAAEDKNVHFPEVLTGDKVESKLPTVPPRLVGDPSASFVKSSSVDLSGDLNPENASTAYAFEYGPCEDLDECPQSNMTTVAESNVYGRIGTTLEATGLQPGTTYRYRLVAVNENGEEAECSESLQGKCEGSFTTALSPAPKAVTEGPVAIEATSAIIAGSADPDGQPATYAFELGLYTGATTQYGIAQSGSTGTVPVREIFPLSGLQPGTEYAYRITVKSGYGTAVGQSVLFKTAPVPAVAPPPPSVGLLPLPEGLKFPKVTPPKGKAACKRGYARNKRGKCVKIKHTSKSKKSVKGSKRHK